MIQFANFLIESLDVDKLKHLEHAEFKTKIVESNKYVFI